MPDITVSVPEEVYEPLASRPRKKAFSEDLGDNRDYAGIRVENPFREA